MHSTAAKPLIRASLLVLLLTLAAAPAPGQSNAFWRAQSIYQIITDRFYDGDPANDNAEGTYAPNQPTGVHGGDFAGIEQKLDYIQSLGATAIWISPIVLNTEGQFHGYSAWNFYAVAPHWGSLASLQHLVQAAHARGLQVIDDIVVNHAGDLVQSSGSAFNYPSAYTLSYADPAKTYPAPFNLSAINPSLTNLFHPYGNIGDFNDPTQTVLGWLDGLNDFRTETPYVRTNMAAIYQYWIQQIGFDAYRVDTALEVDHGCWQSFCPAIHSFAAATGRTNFFMFAETYNGSDAVVGAYTGARAGGAFEFDSVLDYPLYYTLNSVFAQTNGATAQIPAHYAAEAADDDPAARDQLVNFLDNHDNARFLSSSEAGGRTNLLSLALVFLYTSPGIPSLYYGTEQGFDGATDPNDREDMFAGEFKDGPNGSVQQLAAPGEDDFNMTHPLFLWVAELENLRRLYPALSLGSYASQISNTSGPGLLAWSRILGPQEILVALNTSGLPQTLPPSATTYPAGTVLVNLLNTAETVTVGTGGRTPAITLPGLGAKLFLAQAQWQPLDPVVTGNFPAHWAAGVPVNHPVTLWFSQGMDTNATQAAFATVPPVAGDFSWSTTVATNDTLTFSPAPGGFPGLTNVTITVTNTARAAATGRPMHGPYDLTFQTGPSPGSVEFSSPPTNDTVVALGAGATYLVQVCFTPALDTNDASEFSLLINGVLQPRAAYIFRPPGSVPGCPGLRSLLYDWSGGQPGANLLQIIYTNQSVALEAARTVLIPAPLLISRPAGQPDQVSWSSTPGLRYVVLAATNPAAAFQPVSGPITATNFSTTFWDVANQPPAPRKFYQIEQVP